MLYRDAAIFLNDAPGTLRNRIYGKYKKETQAKQIYALVSQTLKYKNILATIVKAAGLLQAEKKLSNGIALVMAYDLLLSKTGRLLCAKCPEKDAILRHKTRLKAELVKYKIKHGLDEVDSDQPPVRWVRVNPVKGTAEEVESTFKKMGLVQVESLSLHAKAWYKDEYVPGLYGIHPKVAVAKMELYKTGHLIIQDRASCFPVTILNPDSSKSYIDACAAPGNKTTQLAGFSKHVDAFERDKKRALTLKKMIDIAGLNKRIDVNVQDFTRSNPDDYQHIAGLVVDPSCSGSGIFGRQSIGDEQEEHQNSQERLEKLSEFQYIIMSHALRFDADAVVYSTCSIHAQENEHVVRRLLETPEIAAKWQLRDREFVLPHWPRRGYEQEFGGEEAKRLAEACVRVMPKVDGGIGFFAACFERRSL